MGRNVGIHLCRQYGWRPADFARYLFNSNHWNCLLKQQGMAVLARIRTEMRNGQAPVTSFADSVALAVGGIFMLIPGYVTDGIGLFLFIPGIRTIAGVY